MGKMGARLMVHPAAVTNAIGKLEQRDLVTRSMSPDDRRVVLAAIAPPGRALADKATEALNQAAFGLAELSPGQAAELTRPLRSIRAMVGDFNTADQGHGAGSPASRGGTGTEQATSD